METQSRWKSYVLWAALVAQVVIIADATGFWNLIGVDKSVALTVVESVLGILVLFGVINNPTNKTGL
jgi:uncharacterized membrane protein